MGLPVVMTSVQSALTKIAPHWFLRLETGIVARGAEDAAAGRVGVGRIMASAQRALIE